MLDKRSDAWLLTAECDRGVLHLYVTTTIPQIIDSFNMQPLTLRDSEGRFWKSVFEYEHCTLVISNVNNLFLITEQFV